MAQRGGESRWTSSRASTAEVHFVARGFGQFHQFSLEFGIRGGKAAFRRDCRPGLVDMLCAVCAGKRPLGKEKVVLADRVHRGYLLGGASVLDNALNTVPWYLLFGC